MSKNRESGQALVIVLLVMSVVLTVALSVVSRSITDISVSQKEEEALRAFSAAEAGVERLLVGTETILAGQLPSGASFDARVSALADGAVEFVVPLAVNSAESVAVWLVGHDSSGNLSCSTSSPCFTGSGLKICWGTQGSSGTVPALELAVLYTQTADDFSGARVARAAFDPDATRRSSNQFQAPDSGSCNFTSGKSFAYQKTIDLTTLGVTARSSSTTFAGPVQARLRLLYNTDRSHPVGVSAVGGSLPRQGSRVESTGTSGAATRKIIVNRLFSDLPPIFDFGVFSGSGDLAK